MLWELSMTEQRYRAVLEVLAGVPAVLEDLVRAVRPARLPWLPRDTSRGQDDPGPGQAGHHRGVGGAGAGHHWKGRRPAVRAGRPRVVRAAAAARREAGRAEPAAGHRRQQHHPGGHPEPGAPAGPALPVPRLPTARRGLRGPPHPAQSPRRHHQREELRPAMPVPPPDRHPPPGLGPGPEPRRHHHRLEQGQDQGPAQPRGSR
jgi:hypothetical protein